jgi:hypothetical protein
MIQTGWLWLPERLPLPVPRTKTVAHEALANSGATEQDSKGTSPELTARSRVSAGRRTLIYAAARALDSCQGVRMRGPSAVTATVNSKWAAREPSCE